MRFVVFYTILRLAEKNKIVFSPSQESSEPPRSCSSAVHIVWFQSSAVCWTWQLNWCRNGIPPLLVLSMSAAADKQLQDCSAQQAIFCSFFFPPSCVMGGISCAGLLADSAVLVWSCVSDCASYSIKEKSSVWSKWMKGDKGVWGKKKKKSLLLSQCVQQLMNVYFTCWTHTHMHTQ